MGPSGLECAPSVLTTTSASLDYNRRSSSVISLTRFGGAA
jgi:hypothetical protein